MDYQLIFWSKTRGTYARKGRKQHQPSLPLNQLTESYSALKTWKWILSVHLLFCAHAKKNKNPFSFVMQMIVGYLETGLYFLNAVELQSFRPSWEWQAEEIPGRKYCGLQDLLPECYIYKLKHYQWSSLKSKGYNDFCSGISVSVGWNNKVPSKSW